MKIYLGADHRGFICKEKLKTSLFGHEVVDLGAHDLDPSDDYTTYALDVAKGVSSGGAVGILICGSGVGMDIAANKVDGVRASVGKQKEQVVAGRHDDDMNVLVIAADYTSEEEAGDMVAVFLATEFSGEERHKRRLLQIETIERGN